MSLYMVINPIETKYTYNTFNLVSFPTTGVKSCTMNIHLLSHLADCVYNWGPLWSYSCFFETMNYHLKKHFHGTKYMSKQVKY